ncbi:MAG: hypothetical protein HON98_06595 [Chloroflexi bacterium]|jgi:hypothetical protein|nr:hypothetical protein [Chloroflexota bacterium]MBT3669432.1 hypothetical protein [Chloroflexota bacterium]MBT4004204.1 hypothetical protein [Chloroflexota bacterium]MBT4304549.1 hypothetical protein [Chloroflexota bacterium]MBT4534110.1 hypothetical protein [Chloroflexota bacterium]
MATTEERMKILQMIQDEKVSAEDGAKLLAALSESKSRRSQNINRNTEGRYMRVRVTDMSTGKTKVSVNLPLSLVDAGLNIASNFIPDMNGDSMEGVSEAIRNGMTGLVVDVEDLEDGEHIQVFIE